MAVDEMSLDSITTDDADAVPGADPCPVLNPTGVPCRKARGHHGAHKFRDDGPAGGADRTEYDRRRRARLKAERAAPGSPSEVRADAAPVEIDPQIIDVLWGVVGATAASAARARGASADEAAVLRITQEELAALREPTLRVLRKYAGSLGRWGDEIALAVVVGALAANKADALRAALAKRGEQPAAVVSRYP